VDLKQILSGRWELTGPCLRRRSVGRYIAPEHRAVFAKLPYERGHSEVVVVPGLECEPVEFSLVHVDPTQKSDTDNRTGLTPVPGPRTCPARLLLMLGPHRWLARAVVRRLPGYSGLSRPQSRRDWRCLSVGVRLAELRCSVYGTLLDRGGWRGRCRW